MEDLKKFVVMELLPDPSGAEVLINKLSEGKLPIEVLEEIKSYARGNYGVATVLTKIAVRDSYVSKDQVETLVGWPLWSHTQKKTELIWDRFKNSV